MSNEDGAHAKVFPRAEVVKTSIGDLQIVPVTIGDMAGWNELLASVLQELGGKDTLSEVEFFSMLMNPDRLIRVLSFIIKRPRTDADGKKYHVNEVANFDELTPSEAFDVVEAFFRVSDVAALMGKAKAAWSRIEAALAPAKPASQAAEKSA